jgi:predicted small secreted protein
MSAFREPASVGRAGLTGLLGILAVGLLALSTSACNTMAGLGQDVQAAGDAVTGTAGDVKDDTE